MAEDYHFSLSASTATLSFSRPILYTSLTLAKDSTPLLLAGAGIAALLLLKGRGKGVSLESLGYSPGDLPKKVYDIPFGAGSSSPAWPVITNHPRRYMVSYRSADGQTVGNGPRRFMADRGGRFHAGLDLYGYPGDIVVAMEDGKIVNTYHFYHDTYALIVQHDSGIVVNYGEVGKNSWKEFGLKIGSRVQKGKAIARVGLMSGGSHMLHFETYASGTDHNIKIKSTKPDARTRNPTQYLLIAKALHQPRDKTVSAEGGVRTIAADNQENGEIEREMTTIVRGVDGGDEIVDGP